MTSPGELALAFLEARRLDRDEIWEGERPIEEDLLVPEGVTITLAPGCRLLLPSRAGCRLIVLGRLIAKGESSRPAAMLVRGLGGLRFMGGGKGTLDFFDVVVEGAGDGCSPVSSHGQALLSWSHGSISGGRTGLVTQGGEARISDLSVKGCLQGLRLDSGRVMARRVVLEDSRDVGAFVDQAEARLEDCLISGGCCGALATGGALELAGCRLQGQTRSALEFSGGASHRVERTILDRCKQGIVASSVEIAVDDTMVCAATTAVSARGGARLRYSGGSIDGEGCGLHVARAQAELSGVSLRGGRRAALVEGGRLRASRLKVVAGRTGIEVCPESEVRLSDCLVRGGAAGVVAAGGRAALEGCRFDEQTVAALDFQKGRHSLNGVEVSGPACGLLLGAADAAARGLKIDVGGDAAAVKDGGSLRVVDSVFTSRACGLSHSGGLVEAERLQVFGGESAVSIGGGAELLWSGGLVEGRRIGVDLVGGRASFVRLAVVGGRVALRAAAGAFLIDGAKLRAERGPAVFVSHGAFGSIVSCALSGRSGIVADGGHVHLARADLSACEVALKTGLAATVCLRDVARVGADRSRMPVNALRRFVVATRKVPGLAAAYQAIYASAIAGFGLWARASGAAAAWVHRGWVTGDWEAGVSDVDFVLARGGLDAAWLRRFWSAYAVFKKALPFLGETLVAEPEDLSAYLRAGGVRAREFHFQARRLAGNAALASGGEPASSLSCLTECAHAYTRLMQWALEEPQSPWSVAARQLQKSALDLLRYGDQAAAPATPAPTRGEYACRAPEDWRESLAVLSAKREPGRDARIDVCSELVCASLRRFDRLAVRFIASVKEGPGPGVKDTVKDLSFHASSNEAEKRVRLRLLDEQRARFDDAVVGAVVDDVYRSRLVLDDAYVAGAMLRESLASRLRLQHAAPRRSTLPLLLTPALQKLLGWLPYLDCPVGFVDDAEFLSAGRLLPGAFQLRWGRLAAAAPPKAVLAVSAREAAANHALTWRLMGWRDAAPAAGPLAHFLLSRRLGLRLLLERGLVASFFDLDGLMILYAREFPEAAAALASLRAPEKDADPVATFFSLYGFLDGIDIVGQSRYSAREAR